MTYSVTQDHERARIQEVIDRYELARPVRIETHCETERSDDWNALIKACNEKENDNG